MMSGDMEQIRESCKKIPSSGDDRYLPLIKQVLSDPEISGETRYCLRKTYNALIDACKIDPEPGSGSYLQEDNFGIISSDSKIAALSLDHPDPERRIAALRSVASMNSPDLMTHILNFLAREKDERVIATFMKTIGRMGKGKSELVGVLAQYLCSDNERIRANCVEGLELLGCPEAIPHLAPVLRDADNRVKANAAKALWVFGRREVLSFLDKMLQSKEEWERDSAVYALGFIPSQGSTNLLVRALEDPSSNVRAGAAAALERLRSQNPHGQSWKTGTIGWISSLVMAAFIGAMIFMIINNRNSPPSGSQLQPVRFTVSENGQSNTGETVKSNQGDLAGNTEAAAFHHSNSAVFLARGDVARAIDEAQKACLLDPSNSKYHISLGQIYGSIGNSPDAISAFSNAMMANPADLQIKRSLATLYMDAGLYSKALTLLQILAEKKPNDGWALTSLGLCHLQNNQMKDARTEMTKALELMPDNPEALMNMAMLLQREGDLEKAIELLKKSSSLDSSDIRIHNRLAVALIKSRRPDEAMPILRKIILMAPRTMAAHQAGELLRDIHVENSEKTENK